MTLLTASRRAVCDLPPDPIEVMRRLQEIATSHPELADDMKRAVALIAKGNATIIDVMGVLSGHRWPEVFE